jgi:hypothetical protein
MKRVTVFADDGPLEGFTFDCGSWEVGRLGELRIYDDDAKPGHVVGRGFIFGTPIVIPPKPPTLKTVLAPGKWSSVTEGLE